MTTDHRKGLVETVMSINIKDFERTPYDNNTLNLSISLKECAFINVLPLGTLEGLWERTKFLISNRSVIQLINGDFCVTDTGKAFKVVLYCIVLYLFAIYHKNVITYIHVY